MHVWSYLAQFFSEWEMLQTQAKKIKMHILCKVTGFPPENLAVYEVWDNLKNIVQPGTPQMTVWFFFLKCTLPVCVTFIMCMDISSNTLVARQYIFTRSMLYVIGNIDKNYDNMVRAHCLLDSWDYKNTFRTCNYYCFCTAKIIARTPLNITLYVHCLCCYSSAYNDYLL